MLWVVESGVFGDAYRSRVAEGASSLGHTVLDWQDSWWETGVPTCTGPVLFHGSLGNADRIRREVPAWQPGVYCHTEAFRCSAWYGHARSWLLHPSYTILTAEQLVANPARAFSDAGATQEAFVRPDSPLKAFSGRVVALDEVSLAALDHGFYFDDVRLPVVVAPVQPVGPEWRFVVVDGRVVAGSGYLPDGRQAVSQAPEGAAWQFAADVAAALQAPEAVYVLDVCDTPGGLRVIEVNPFSGADLYACDLARVMAAVAQWVDGLPPTA